MEDGEELLQPSREGEARLLEEEATDVMPCCCGCCMLPADDHTLLLLFTEEGTLPQPLSFSSELMPHTLEALLVEGTLEAVEEAGEGAGDCCCTEVGCCIFNYSSFSKPIQISQRSLRHPRCRTTQVAVERRSMSGKFQGEVRKDESLYESSKLITGLTTEPRMLYSGSTGNVTSAPLEITHTIA